MSNSTIEQKDLSFEELGFLTFLLSKPDNWRVRPAQIAEERGMHRVSIYRLLNRLIDKGYVRREMMKNRKENGQFEQTTFYFVNERAAKETECVLLKGEEIPF